MADLFTSFLENRIRNLSPFGNTEEEDTGNVKPVTQTIKTDPVTGEQTMTVKGSPYDLSAANPNTPTLSTPMGGINNLAGPQTQMPSLALWQLLWLLLWLLLWQNRHQQRQFNLLPDMILNL
jgi:hypothetical protein